MSDLTPVELIPIVESTFGLDGGAMFGIIPKPLWTRTNPADDANRITLAARCLLLRSADRLILIDAGMGLKWHDKEQKIYDLQSTGDGLRALIEQQGVDPNHITDVVLTHLHFDHVGGLTHLKEGELVPTFPNATHWVQRENWVWAHHPSRRDAGSYRRENFEILGSSGGPDLRLLDGNTTILDTIEAITCRGHTPGMQVLRVNAKHNNGVVPVVFLADLIPTHGHLQLPYVMGYDLEPLATVREKHEILEHCIANDWVLCFQHEPGDPFARVEKVRTEKYRFAARSKQLSELG